MNENEANNLIGVHLRGTFFLRGHPESNFHGPIKRGLRVLLWADSSKHATSCSFVNDSDLYIGDVSVLDVVIGTPRSLENGLHVGNVYSVGFPGVAIGEFKLTEIVGEWTEKMP